MALTVGKGPIDWTFDYFKLAGDDWPTNVPTGSTCLVYETTDSTGVLYVTPNDGTNWIIPNTQALATNAIRDVFGGGTPGYPRCVVASPVSVATGSLFTCTGIITIVNIGGFIPVTGLNGTSTLRLGFVADALAEVFLCAASANTQWGVGTLFTVTGTALDAMVATTTVPAAPTMAVPWTIGCTTVGIIRLTAGTARAGLINWWIKWMPETTGATLVAA